MLTLENVEVVYHSASLVLKGISLQVPAGGVVALLGPNGAGKTSVLRAITGLLDLHDGEVTKGTVRLGEQSLIGLRPEAVVRAGLSQVMEGRRVFADLTVEENLRAGGYSRTRAQVNSDLERFYAQFPVLAERRRQLAGYLSGGEQQMLAIARALMAEPRVLLLDEPSLGLAPRAAAQVGELIRDINRTGVAILLVEQNARMALDLASYGYILENGKVVLDGPSVELAADKDIQEFYLGFGREGHKSFREVKHYRRRKRWLS